MQIIKLNKGRDQSIVRRHPWIFSRALQKVPKSVSDGDIVQIQDEEGNIIGIGHYQDSSLAVRLLAFENVNIDAAFWKKRLTDAFQYRNALGFLKTGITDCFRLVHGEGDQLPGLIVDVYNNVAVVQAHSIGMHKARHEIADALITIKGLTIDAVYAKSKEALPGEYATAVQDEWLKGNAVEEIIAHEGGLQFIVNVMTGQKTGFFLDQRINRELVEKYSKGATVLNCFSYTGGFSLYALQGGAKNVLSIDSSATALNIAEKNAALNSFADQHETLKENVLTYLTKTEDLFDIIVVDPPAFAKNLSKRHNAIQAYKRLNILAMARVKPGGMLFTFSCSQVVDRELFHNTIVAAAIESNRMARVMHELSQGPDHPTSIFHPEGHYLKGLALYLD
jgi:23S rRNA (cytosine1962-C5)-methyltransferase